MRIPLITNPDTPAAQATFAPMNATTFDRVGQAGMRLGSAIAGTADLAVEIKTAIDTGTLAKVQTDQETHLAGFVDSLSDGENTQNGDPATFLPRWNDAMATLKDQFANDSGVRSLSINARTEYQAGLARWQALATQRVGHIATEKAVSNAVANIRTAYNAKVETNDVEGAIADVKRGVATGVFNPEEGALLIANAPAKAEENQAYELMNLSPDVGGGPIRLEEVLRETKEDGTYEYYPNLTGHSRETLTHYAYQQANALRSQTAQEYAEQAAGGTMPDPNRVVSDLRMGKLTKAQATALLKPVKVYNPASFAEISNAIAAADLAHDADHTKEAKIRAMINVAQPDLDGPSTTRLNDVLKDALDPKSSHNTPVASEIFKNAAAERSAGLFLPRAMAEMKVPSGHWFIRDAKKQVMAEQADVGTGDVAHWRETAPKAIRDAEDRHYSDYLTKMRAYFSSYAAEHNGKEPTDAEATEYSQSIKRPYVMDAIGAVLTGNVPKAIPKAHIDLLRKDPSTAAITEFDELYGAGMGNKVLGK